jgi:hypothetical protein
LIKFVQNWSSETLCSEVLNLIQSIWNRDRFPQEQKECIIVPICNTLENAHIA